MVIDYLSLNLVSLPDIFHSKPNLRSWKQMCVEIRALEVSLADKKPRGLVFATHFVGDRNSSELQAKRFSSSSLCGVDFLLII